MVGLNGLRLRGPKVLGGVGAPWAPGFGAVEQDGRAGPCAIEESCAAEETDVGYGKGIGLAERAESDVVGSPFADAADCAEAGDRFLDGAEGAKEIGIGCGGFSE